jgi:cyclopropane-fatty-acyl-phospholipid synthase
MNEVTLTAQAPLAPPAATIAPEPGVLQRWLRSRVLQQLSGLTQGVLTLDEGHGVIELGTAAADPAAALRATVRVRDPEFYVRVALNGSVGAAEAYMDGLWSCDDLVSLVRILVRNRDQLDAMEQGPARLGAAALRAWGACRRNTRAGSRRNIAAHYDLGNDFFKLFLDDRMMYSAAIYRDASESLEAASRRKLERICHKLQLGPGTRVIEIGSGWGGFALHAAATTGCHVTTATISREQYALACERVQAAGLQDRVKVLLTDYRELSGRYDRLVSIEMIEAIGHQYLDTYFDKVSSLLTDDGMALIQAITIEDHRYAQALRSVDFIKRYIFPGSFIPSINCMIGSVSRVTDLKLFNLEDIGPSYALTLREWRCRFLNRRAEVRAMGYPERFVRMWEFYLAYCEGGFIERSTGDVQMLLTKPGARRGQYLSG